MLQKIIFLLLAVVVGGAVVADQPYRLGVIVPLSGEYASLGNFIRNGAELAVLKRPESERGRLQILYEDDQLDPKRSIAAYRKLVDLQQVKAVAVFGSAVGHALSPLAEKDGVVLLAVAASDPKVTAGKAWSFIHWISPESEAHVMIEEIKRRGYRRLGLLRQEQAGILAWNEAFHEQLRRQSLAHLITVEQSYPMEARNFEIFIAKAKAARVDAVCVTVFSGALAAFAKQARDLGLHAELFGAESFEDWSEVQAADGALRGAWYAYPHNGGRSFQAAYRDRHSEPPGFGAANAFDVVQLLYDGLAAGARDNEALRRRLHGLRDYCGASGCYSATGDNRFTLPVMLKQVTADGFEELRHE